METEVFEALTPETSVWTDELTLQVEGGKTERFWNNKNFMYGIMIGVGVGAIANVTQWWLNKKKREKMLQEINWTIDRFESALINNFQVPAPDGSVVDISEFRVNNTEELIMMLNHKMYEHGNVLKGDERLQWLVALERLIKLAQKIQINEVARHKA